MVFRERRRSRHHAVEPRSTDATEDDELESYLAAISPAVENAGSELTGRFGSAQVFQLRLPGLRIEQLRLLAEARGMSTTALVVEWVLQRLDQEDPDQHQLFAPRGGGPSEPTASVTPLRMLPPLAPLDAITPHGEVTRLAARTRAHGSDAHPAGARHRAPSS